MVFKAFTIINFLFTSLKLLTNLLTRENDSSESIPGLLHFYIRAQSPNF